ncbi:dihydrofolate reductase family protein [Streptomyces sp. HNM0574]|uniref:dihydrofolate reductase family protein n=1 Tax=Streptomyces sp. HNM0574 TaxID=2714954 RepID=UPI00146DB6E2|nr:dihydrofolate reductase family protein [Streptomyces sp. HNM0574]NLU68681.1 dihydrofolate reductase family protein [Streptomyces sp. HNM0574]
MARLIYAALMSLDGYVADEDGAYEWSAPDEELLSFINALERPVGTYLYGRRMYEEMRVWEDPETVAAQPPEGREFARVWQAADKVVYSTSLPAVTTSRTRLLRAFEPGEVRRLKESAAADLNVSGPELAGHAIRAGLVDEFQMYVTPFLVGGGKPALPRHARLDLELLEERRFGNGTVLARYRPRAAPGDGPR